MSAKILVVGSVGGKLRRALKKIENLHDRENFTFALIAGNLVNPDVDDDNETIQNLIRGTEDVALKLPVYFYASSALPSQVMGQIENNDGDICENLHCIGLGEKRSTFTTASGVRIVSLGSHAPDEAIGGETVGNASLGGAERVDILITAQWPSGISSRSKIRVDENAVARSKYVADLCAHLQPRYHFSTADFSWEREPFTHQSSPSNENTRTTRFIALAPFGTKANKSLYAFNLQVGEALTSVPPGSTMSPFLPIKGTKRRAEDIDGGQFDNLEGRHPARRRRHRERSPPPGPSDCFLCLANEHVESHLLCSIGNHSYLAAAKGPLPTSDTFSSFGLNFPCHQLVIPFAHAPTLRAIPEEGQETFDEIMRYKNAFQAMVAACSNFKLGAVCFEISRGRNIHAHIQMMAFPIESLRLVEAAFKVEGENRGYPPFESSGIDEEADYFRLWIWSDDRDTGIQSKELVLRLGSFRFDLQFPRHVLAKLLRLEQRAIWRDIIQSKDDETADTERFKEAFKPWDFTLREE